MKQYNKNINNAAVPVDGLPENVASGSENMQPVVATDNDYLNRGLKSLFGDDFDINDRMSQDLLFQYLRSNKEQNEKLSEALERDPRIAQMLADMVEGKRNAYGAVARYFGNSFVNVNENSPEFEEVMIADEERKQEIMRLANDRREYEANLEESLPVIENFCKERGYDPSEFMDCVWEQIVFPIMAGKYTPEVCTVLDHAITYERDVENAFNAGDIKGRNTNIQRMRGDFGDGLPKGMSSVAPDTAEKRPRNSLIAKALNA